MTIVFVGLWLITLIVLLVVRARVVMLAAYTEPYNTHIATSIRQLLSWKKVEWLPGHPNKRFDSVRRAQEKQLAREQDERDLLSGRISSSELAKRNGAFAFPKEHVRILEYK